MTIGVQGAIFTLPGEDLRRLMMSSAADSLPHEPQSVQSGPTRGSAPMAAAKSAAIRAQLGGLRLGWADVGQASTLQHKPVGDLRSETNSRLVRRLPGVDHTLPHREDLPGPDPDVIVSRHARSYRPEHETGTIASADNPAP